MLVERKILAICFFSSFSLRLSTGYCLRKASSLCIPTSPTCLARMAFAFSSSSAADRIRGFGRIRPCFRADSSGSKAWESNMLSNVSKFCFHKLFARLQLPNRYCNRSPSPSKILVARDFHRNPRSENNVHLSGTICVNLRYYHQFMLCNFN